MRIYIKSRVHKQIDEFYDYALHKHITLSERIVDAKKKSISLRRDALFLLHKMLLLN